LLPSTARGAFAAFAVLLLAAPVLAQDDLATLVARLGSADANLRSQAYTELQRRRDPAMVPLLARDLEKMPRQGQQYAIWLLRSQPIDATRAVFAKLLREGDAYLRVAAASALAMFREPGAPAQLAAALAATPAVDRLAALSFVYAVDDPQVADALVGWLQPGAAAALVTGVLRHLVRRDGGRTAAIGAAVERLREAADAGVRAAALAWLAGSDRAAADALADLLAAEPELFWSIDDLLDGERKLPPRLVEAMTKALAAPRSRYDVTRVAALLQRQQPGLAVPELRRLLREGQAEFRAAALEALAAIPGGLTDRDLQALLHGDDLAARVAAADTLRNRDDLSGLPVLLELLPKAKGKERRDAVEALAGFRVRRIGPVLLDLLDDGEVGVRQQAWTGLQNVMRSLFPYRRFDFERCGYSPQASARAAGIAVLRAWWAAVP
jgi:hypothetical protein